MLPMRCASHGPLDRSEARSHDILLEAVINHVVGRVVPENDVMVLPFAVSFRPAWCEERGKENL